MNNYQDQWSRYHHKVCIEGTPSGGNGYLFTAYAVKAGLKVDGVKLSECWDLCSKDGILIRNPYAVTSPFSRDEILGSSYLGLLKPEQLNNWNFSPFPIPRFSLLTLIKQLYDLRPSLNRHRNYFWINNLDQIYRFAFSTPIQDRHFLLKNWGKFQWYNPVHIFYAAYAKVDSLFGKSGIKWLKYGGGENKKAMVLEFPTDHPISLKLGL